MTTMTAQTTQVYSVFIRATPEQVWDGITKPEFTSRYFYGSVVEYVDMSIEEMQSILVRLVGHL